MLSLHELNRMSWLIKYLRVIMKQISKSEYEAYLD